MENAEAIDAEAIAACATKGQRLLEASRFGQLLERIDKQQQDCEPQ